MGRDRKGSLWYAILDNESKIMRIGVPKEIKPLEGRVALVPEAAAQLVRRGHQVTVESCAGVASGYPDTAYEVLGVSIADSAEALYGGAEMIVKVKEPIEPEYALLREDHLLFSYLHLAATPVLTRTLMQRGLTAVAFETVQVGRSLPLLAPMSDIAGKLAVQIGATLLHAPAGGRGILLGGLPAAERGSVVVLGPGQAGGNAAAMAAGMGAQVTVFGLERSSLERMRAIGPNVSALYSFHDAVEAAVVQADLLIGAVLIPGAKTPHLITEDVVKSMKQGSVIVDIAVDQGGCIETTRPTDYTNPTYVEHGVTHFAVTNMPGAVPRSASQALSAALIPYVQKLAQPGWEEDPALKAGINVKGGRIVHPAVAAAMA